MEEEKLQLISFGDPLLKMKPTKFDFGKDDAVEEAKELRNKLYACLNETGGVGLSANQTGIDSAVFVMTGKNKDAPRIVFNPEITAVSEEECVMKEGCLSYPGLWLMIKRPTSCTMTYQNEEGQVAVEEFIGTDARIVLHEFDHMMGVNFTMRASKLKIQRALKALDKKVAKYRRRANVR